MLQKNKLLQVAYDLFQEYKEVKDGIDGAKELMKENDPEIKEMAKMELDELEERMPILLKIRIRINS